MKMHCSQPKHLCICRYGILEDIWETPCGEHKLLLLLVNFSKRVAKDVRFTGSIFNSSGKYLVAGRGEVLMLQFQHFQKLLRLI